MLDFSKRQQEAANRVNSGNVPVVGSVIGSDIIEIIRNGKKQNARLSSLSALLTVPSGDYYIKPKGGIPLADLSSDAVNYLHTKSSSGGGGGTTDFSFTLAGITVTNGSVVTLSDMGIPAWALGSSVPFSVLPSMYIGNASVQSTLQTAQTLGGIGAFTSSSVTTDLLTIGSNSLSYDSTAQAWHITGSLYVDGDLSSGDASGGGGGGYVNMAAVWASLKNTDTDHTYDNEQINPAHLVTALTGYSTTSYVDTAIATLKGNAPSNLDTLGELAAAVIANTTAISGKANTTDLLSTVTVGSNVYNVVNRNVTLPAYPTRLADLSEDDNHKLVTLAEKQAWTNKQDAIQDLSTIRSGAAAGATALQQSDLNDIPRIGTTIEPASQDFPINVELTDASGNAIEPYCPFLEDAISEKVGKTGDSTISFLVRSLLFRRNPVNATKYTSLTYDTSSNPKRLTLTDTYTTPIQSDSIAYMSDITQSKLKSTLGISDWALAANAPTYSFSDLTWHPTTINDYGITDAKIESGTITLGSNTITPLTASNFTDYVTLTTNQNNISGAKTFTSTVTVTGDIRLDTSNSHGNIFVNFDGASRLGERSKRFREAHIGEINAGQLYLYDGSNNFANAKLSTDGNSRVGLTLFKTAGNTRTNFGAVQIDALGSNTASVYWSDMTGSNPPILADLGTTNNRWGTVYSSVGNFSGSVTASRGIYTNSIINTTPYDLNVGNGIVGDSIIINNDMRSDDEDEDFLPYWEIGESTGAASFKSLEVNHGTATIGSNGYVKTPRLYLDQYTYLYKDGDGNWHIADSRGNAVNLIVDGDISCAG